MLLYEGALVWLMQYTGSVLLYLTCVIIAVKALYALLYCCTPLVVMILILQQYIRSRKSVARVGVLI